MKENYAGKLTEAQEETTKPGYNSASPVNLNWIQNKVWWYFSTLG